MSRLILTTLALLASSSSAYASVTVNSTALALAAPAGTSVLVDFDTPMPAGFTLTGGLVQNVSNDQGAEPAGDTSYYLSANPGDSATLMSATGFTEASLYWGSMDDYNTVTLLDKDGGTIASYTGAQVFSPANGDQSGAATNRHVDFTTSGLTSPIYGLEFQSSSPALEVDNVAFSAPVGGVPEPTTWGMMISGLGLVGAAMRRNLKTGALALLMA